MDELMGLWEADDPSELARILEVLVGRYAELERSNDPASHDELEQVVQHLDDIYYQVISSSSHSAWDAAFKRAGLRRSPHQPWSSKPSVPTRSVGYSVVRLSPHEQDEPLETYGPFQTSAAAEAFANRIKERGSLWIDANVAGLPYVGWDEEIITAVCDAYLPGNR